MSTHAARYGDRLRRAVAALLLLAGTGHALALPGDSDQPISIAADRAEHDDARRVTIYRETWRSTRAACTSSATT